ncbi:MAG: hypothetical protein HDR88_02110 [Bacteroides sp.]|nr:hypothetical protein [Bacteroides sp.]
MSNMLEVAQSIKSFCLLTFYRKPRSIVSLIIKRKKWCHHDSYFPEKKRKGEFRIFFEQLVEILKYGYLNEFYFPYGFDVKTRKQKSEYFHYVPFSRLRDKQNINPHSTTAVLRDKLLFGMFTAYYGIKSAGNIAVSSPEGLFELSSKKYISVEDFIKSAPKDLFMKPVDGECGDGIYKVHIKDGKITANGCEIGTYEFADILSSTDYLVQESITQHNVLAKLHPQSLNTIRLVTIRNPKTNKPEVFPSILRIGTGDAVVDNTSQGGLAVGINLETGQLKDFGFYKPSYGTKVAEHPDSGIRLAGVQIPYFDECKRQAVFLHSHLTGIKSIGWDIAVGSEGPIFVEGNDNWEINGPQICNGGLKKLFMSYYKN